MFKFVTQSVLIRGWIQLLLVQFCGDLGIIIVKYLWRKYTEEKVMSPGIFVKIQYKKLSLAHRLYSQNRDQKTKGVFGIEVF